jgi:hypothetical protein
MARTVTNTFVGGEKALASEVNQNFTDALAYIDLIAAESTNLILTDLVETDSLQDLAVTFAKLNTALISNDIVTDTGSTSKLTTVKAVEDYVVALGTIPMITQKTWSAGSINYEPSPAQQPATNIHYDDVISINCDVCMTADIGNADAKWWSVNSTYRASGTDGGRAFGSCWYEKNGDTISLYCNVYSAVAGDPDFDGGNKTVRWTIFHTS